jgi:hypothetical protein
MANNTKPATNTNTNTNAPAAAPAASPAPTATWQPPATVLPPRGTLPGLTGRTVPAVVWQLCGPGTKGATLAAVQAAIAALGLRGQHTAQGMLARYAKHHGCTVTVQGTGAAALYSVSGGKSK